MAWNMLNRSVNADIHEQKKETDMVASWTRGMVVWGLSLLFVVPVYAQSQQDAATVLNRMSPDVLAKIQSLAHILQQALSEGKLTEKEILQGMMSGQLHEKLLLLNPEAGQLLHDISDASKQRKGPGEESLMPLLEGLGLLSE